MIKIDILVLNDRCVDCPVMELETVDLIGFKKTHRCKHIQKCNALASFWQVQKEKGENEDGRN